MVRHLMFLLVLLFALMGCNQAQPEVATPQPTETVVPSSSPVPPTPTTEPSATASPTKTPSATASATASPTVTPTPTMEPTVTPFPTQDVTATPGQPWTTGEVWIFPGPDHYAGDVLTFEIPVENYVSFGRITGTVTLDGGSPFEWNVEQSYNPVMNVTSLVFPNLFEATGETITHTVRLETTLDNGEAVSAERVFAVQPAEARPQQEQEAVWTSIETECCEIRYLTQTAAAREIEMLAEELQESVEYVEERLGTTLEENRYEVVLLDGVWGNGAYASEELVASYVDRDYFALGTGFMESLFRHEATHLAVYEALDWSWQTPGFLGEGIAVYIAGGHYRPEPIPERAAALYQLGYYVPIQTLAEEFGSMQHEIRYLESAAVVAYIVETYGWEAFVEFVGTELEDEGGSPRDWLEAAFEGALDVSLEEGEAGFLAWLQAHEPGDQLDDLRLTVALNNTRRQYQREDAPYQALWALGSIQDVPQVGNVIREARAPENIALETMLIQAREALLAGEYEEAEVLRAAVQVVLDDGEYTRAPVADYLAVARVLAAQGYEAQRIAISGDSAEVVAIRVQPTLETLMMERRDGEWRMVGP